MGCAASVTPGEEALLSNQALAVQPGAPSPAKQESKAPDKADPWTLKPLPPIGAATDAPENASVPEGKANETAAASAIVSGTSSSRGKGKEKEKDKEASNVAIPGTVSSKKPFVVDKAALASEKGTAGTSSSKKPIASAAALSSPSEAAKNTPTAAATDPPTSFSAAKSARQNENNVAIVVVGFTEKTPVDTGKDSLKGTRSQKQAAKKPGTRALCCPFCMLVLRAAEEEEQDTDEMAQAILRDTAELDVPKKPAEDPTDSTMRNKQKERERQDQEAKQRKEKAERHKAKEQERERAKSREREAADSGADSQRDRHHRHKDKDKDKRKDSDALESPRRDKHDSSTDSPRDSGAKSARRASQRKERGGGGDKDNRERERRSDRDRDRDRRDSKEPTSVPRVASDRESKTSNNMQSPRAPLAPPAFQPAMTGVKLIVPETTANMTTPKPKPKAQAPSFDNSRFRQVNNGGATGSPSAINVSAIASPLKPETQFILGTAGFGANTLAAAANGAVSASVSASVVASSPSASGGAAAVVPRLPLDGLQSEDSVNKTARGRSSSRDEEKSAPVSLSSSRSKFGAVTSSLPPPPADDENIGDVDERPARVASLRVGSDAAVSRVTSDASSTGSLARPSPAKQQDPHEEDLMESIMSSENEAFLPSEDAAPGDDLDV